MTVTGLHLNLLREAERVSSSPVRLRVMLPILALLACVAMLGWWAMLLGQQMLVKSQMNAIQGELDARKTQYEKVVADMLLARDLQAELDQLALYEKGRLAYGETFARLADVVPPQVQLVSLEIAPPPPQDLVPPGTKPNAKYVPLLGPTGTVETVHLRLLGRTPKETPLLTLMDALAKPTFSNALQIVRAPVDKVSPRIHSFRQDMSQDAGKGPRLLAFDIEYTCRERRFEK